MVQKKMYPLNKKKKIFLKVICFYCGVQIMKVKHPWDKKKFKPQTCPNCKRDLRDMDILVVDEEFGKK